MIRFRNSIGILILSCLLFINCGSESNSNEKKQDEEILGKVELSDGWARPGTKGQTGGAYLTIANGTASSDTLVAVNSTAAQSAEIHRTVQHDDGTMSMQRAGQQVIAPATSLELKPGGLHIMLMNLNRDLTVGDSLSLTLRFSRVGPKSITVPVQLQQ